MHDLRWNDVTHLFDPEQLGALPDIRIPETTSADWQALFDLVAEQGWMHVYSEGAAVRPLPAAAHALARLETENRPTLRLRPYPELLVIFWISSVDEIEFDIDLRTFQGQDHLDRFCAFLRTIGRRLHKPVVMDGTYGPPVLAFDPVDDRFVLLTDPPASDHQVARQF